MSPPADVTPPPGRRPRVAPRLLMSVLALVTGITALVIAILLVRGVLL